MNNAKCCALPWVTLLDFEFHLAGNEFLLLSLFPFFHLFFFPSLSSLTRWKVIDWKKHPTPNQNLQELALTMVNSQFHNIKTTPHWKAKGYTRILDIFDLFHHLRLVIWRIPFWPIFSGFSIVEISSLQLLLHHQKRRITWRIGLSIGLQRMREEKYSSGAVDARLIHCE